ncbi:MAG: AI-2E family transporter [Acaryochloridaceae cyanobacterium CSU_3_4]|nr:AI-2E family transporter [Acaryochloridaceae cyanobacterium CSU_3_4]
MLNFPIQLLQHRGIHRLIAVGIVLTVSLLVLVVLGLTLVPLIIEQLSGLVTSLPSLIDSGTQQLEVIQKWRSPKSFRLR